MTLIDPFSSPQVLRKRRCKWLRLSVTCLTCIPCINRCAAFTPIPTPTTAGRIHFTPQLLRLKQCSAQQSTLARCYAHRQGLIEPDYLITDCIDIDNRPSFLDLIAKRPSIQLRMALLTIGTAISLSNVVGNYNNVYILLEVIAIPLGFLTTVLDYIAAIPPYAAPTETVSPNVRCGTADDAVIHLYASIYTAAASWLALRVSSFCPSWLPPLDPVLGLSAAAIFLFSLLAPILTLLHHAGLVDAKSTLLQMVKVARLGQVSQLQDDALPTLTDTELLRAKSLIAVGVVGCLFAPIAIKFALADADWWSRVLTSFPAQGILESSTALFGVFATQASLVGHTAAKSGVAPFQLVAPAFAVVCCVLAIVPCACSLYWLGNDISFFSQYAL